MKQTAKLFLVALVAGALTLGGYKYFVEPNTTVAYTTQDEASFIPTNYSSNITAAIDTDFTDAAEKTVNAVVHVKNTTISRQPSNIMEYFYGGGQARPMVGSGSGVIISPDGYIVTNNHVIENASQLQVTLNDNRTYNAELIGTDPKTDIALIKLDSNEEFPFVPFGDSNNVKIGEWVLAVGNPFNLTSTVTAGIVSAKARDLNEFDGNPQSFIQTDAAVNRGNSGGALVNTRGELIGINTAITSETGSYVGYSFAVPSNNARKVVEDIMEFGGVQRGILGISTLPTKLAQKQGIDITQGVYVAAIEKGSGADKGGLKEGDIIKQIDGYEIAKFSDLVGYLGSKRPNDVVDVTVDRKGTRKTVPVTLIKLETFTIEDTGLEVRNANKAQLDAYGVDNGVVVSNAATKDMLPLKGAVIVRVNDKNVTNIDDVREIMKSNGFGDPVKLTFVDRNGQLNSYIFR
ncbi:trypsin-like peptidase domain-containing protein [Marinirhabdus gelatinilytica]|uniref:Do/DeqQ family serine protease n=1 Tax=Marinirhabdus gelatinilytica TaxID=1703343 RepID=A0A370QFM8_9FLAO|nr:trypsin-like peptidase domain-containing protein [Marinirhabdus gelatinilytica]RDK86840.1 Do/DeqQ family serine protease [Marinirhabdus gelatinilytica]